MTLREFRSYLKRVRGGEILGEWTEASLMTEYRRRKRAFRAALKHRKPQGRARASRGEGCVICARKR